MKDSPLRRWSAAMILIVGVTCRGEPAAQSPASFAPHRASIARPAPSAPDLTSQGFRSYDLDRFAAAANTFEQALTAARATHDSASEADALRGIGLVRYRRGAYPAAREALDASLAIVTRLGDRHGLARVNTNLAALAYATGDRGTARTLYEEVIQTFDTLGDERAKAGAMRGLYFAIGTFDPRADALLAAALAIARRVADRRLEGEILHSQGDSCFLHGDLAGALQRLGEAAALLEQSGPRSSLARVFVSTGRVYRAHGRPSRAIAYYRRALAIQEAIGDRLMVSQSLNAIGVAYSAMDRSHDAIRHFERAVAISHELGAQDAERQWRTNLADAYMDVSQFRRAADLLVPLAAQAPSAYLTSLTNESLSRAYLGLREYDRALDAIDAAFAAGAVEATMVPGLWKWRAEANAGLGRNDEALAAANHAMDEIERLRQKLVPTDFLKQGFGDERQQLFAFVIDLLHRGGRDREALEASERARARAFLDLLARPRDRSAAAGTGGEASAVGAVRGGHELENSAFATPPSADQLTAIARRLHSAIVSYWVGEKATLVWVIDADGHVNSASIRVSSGRLASLVRATSDDMDAAAGRAPARAWRELHDLLIRPILSFLPRTRGSLLTIVPHGPLFRLSFAALRDARDTYLIERFQLHYVPSGGSLLYLESRPVAPDSVRRYLLVGDPAELASRGAATLPPLPGAAHEVAAILKTLPAGTATVLTGARASEDGVRRVLAGQSVIHLATHGVLHDDRPLDSFLALGGSGRDQASDGRLTTADIYGLTLDAELVVLSACRSARGRVTGDGVLGMTRAFMYAGVPSIVATLWDVADQPAAELMPAFYRTWRRGMSKSAALRAAQLQLLARLRAGRVTVQTPAGARALTDHPFFWAGFTLVGEP